MPAALLVPPSLSTGKASQALVCTAVPAALLSWATSAFVPWAEFLGTCASLFHYVALFIWGVGFPSHPDASRALPLASPPECGLAVKQMADQLISSHTTIPGHLPFVEQRT